MKGIRPRLPTTFALSLATGLIAVLIAVVRVALAQQSEGEQVASATVPAAPVVECTPPKPRHLGDKKPQLSPGYSSVCFAPPPEDRTCLGSRALCDKDAAVAAIAWRYFENNYHPETGLTNAADAFPSTTMWDAGSSLIATIAANEIGLITRKQFDDRITALIKFLTTQKLYHDEAPNKAYNAATGQMSDYANKASDGIGFSALDLGRMASALDMLGCMHPQYAPYAKMVLERWKYCRIIHDGQMYGAYINPATKKESLVQEGRLGYEQYSGKIFASLGFDLDVSATYKNEFATTVVIYGVPIVVDTRDPRKLGAFNYVVTESYALDAMENGLDSENGALVRNIYEVQKRRWKETAFVTAVSEDNVDRAPYFVYNTIYAAGSPWNAITDTGKDQTALKTLSVKAAFSLLTLFPNDPYSRELAGRMASAYDEKKGWYSGIYESGIGYNRAITANTNGIILEALLYKKMGPIHAACTRCRRAVTLKVPSCGCRTCAE